MFEKRLRFSDIAVKNNATNLALGFPDYIVHEVVTKALSSATLSSVIMNQYTRGAGHPRLTNILSKIYSKLTNHAINPQTDIVITVGGFEAIYCAIYSHVNPGDEVIIIEPYEPVTRFANGIPVFVPLRPTKKNGVIRGRDWVLDPKELRSKFSSKTKMIILNTPNNPTGKIFTLNELQMIAKLCIEFNTLVLMDEVYEWMTFDDNNHIRMSKTEYIKNKHNNDECYFCIHTDTLPGMWNRTITVGSAGKTFSVTGWKIGYAYGPEHLIKPLKLVHQYAIAICSTPLQEALAVAYEMEYERLNQPSSFFKQFAISLQQKRDLIVKMFNEVNMNVVIPDGGFFVIVDFSNIAKRVNFASEEGETKDWKFVNWLSKYRQLQAIPYSVFYSKNHRHISQNFIRLCFAKKNETLEEVRRIIHGLKQLLN
ncbi:Kynurenine--oxoglutarate transaminase 3-like protein [Leptotrombidium deliense]|uniref:kynurenine--oxoglutarate transaminase n=1 Tax=Leptotrombidium deliense TaxID=299467 RepID=A0A443S523_9ACAR|nr:Kynurenine--oxoglutarate transaminase 3-like protein [Leptotrombidium deliense]